VHIQPTKLTLKKLHQKYPLLPRTSMSIMNLRKGLAQCPWRLNIPYQSWTLKTQLSVLMVCFLFPKLEMSLLMFANIIDPVAMFGPNLPQEYIKLIPHPHSPDPTVKIIAVNASHSHSNHPVYMPQPELRPWAPFKTLADFEYTETAILGLLPKWIINKQLNGFNSNWAERSWLTIKNFTEMEKVLSKARKYFVQVSRDQLFSPSLMSHPIIPVQKRCCHCKLRG